MSGKWRLLQDLRKVNETMKLMGALQPGLPHPSAIPKDTYKIVLDLKDCFYTIPLHPQDCKRFAFSIPSLNFQEPMKNINDKFFPKIRLTAPPCVRSLSVRQLVTPENSFLLCISSIIWMTSYWQVNRRECC